MQHPLSSAGARLLVAKLSWHALSAMPWDGQILSQAPHITPEEL